MKNSNTNTPKMERPSVIEVLKYLNEWDNLENYTLQESALRKLFSITYPKNDDLDQILIKVAALNDFYSTHVRSRFEFGLHIFELNIDIRLASGDLTLVNDLAGITWSSGEYFNLLSFASKYCSHHFPDKFVIFDYYVQRVLEHFRDSDHFYDFNSRDLRDYEKLHRVIVRFRDFYFLNGFSLKDIDRYLWQFGKEHFPRNYKAKSDTIKT